MIIIGNIKDRKSIFILSILSIVLSVLGISINFLVLTSVINAKDYNDLKQYGWEMSFNGLSNVELTGSAKELSMPYIVKNSTIIKNFNVEFENSNDSASYTFNVKNSGIYDSVISDIILTEPQCYGSGNSASSDSKLVCDNIEFYVTYSSGKKIEKNDVLKKGAVENLKIFINYTGVMPVNSVRVENLSMSIIYIQK